MTAPSRLFVLLLLLFVVVLSCRAKDPERRCPAPFAKDPARASALVARLCSNPEGALVLASVPPHQAPFICFGPAAPSSITTSGIILLDRELDEPEAAARIGHLLEHAALEMPKTGDCEAQVSAMLSREARALALELRLRRGLGVRARRIPYAFEDAFWAAPAEQREGLVLEYLLRHPDGAPGLDALASGYARRCRETEER